MQIVGTMVYQVSAFKTWMFLRHKNFVFLGPGTFRYSQEHFAKKNAPVKSSLMALSAVEMKAWIIFVHR
jgi:hypothetical protein